MKNLGQYVKELREESQKTLQDLSNATGISGQCFWNLEKGIGTVHIKHLPNMAKVLGVDPELLFLTYLQDQEAIFAEKKAEWAKEFWRHVD
jgi:transcriptional regulator with XRE-family HTH domain